MRYILFGLPLLALLMIVPLQGFAQELVYRPKNPAFGGSPLNYQWLMSSASTQNQYKENSNYGYQQDPMADFQQSLQRQILSELSRNIINQKFGENLDLSQEKTIEFGEFSINVSPGMEGVNIRIQNILTGEETNITIPSLNG